MSNRQDRGEQAGDVAAAPVNAEGVDSESEALSNNPQFLAILEKARAQKGKGSFSSEKMRRALETESSTP